MNEVVEYTVTIQHSVDGDVDIAIQGVGDSDSDRLAIV